MICLDTNTKSTPLDPEIKMHFKSIKKQSVKNPTVCSNANTETISRNPSHHGEDLTRASSPQSSKRVRSRPTISCSLQMRKSFVKTLETARLKTPPQHRRRILAVPPLDSNPLIRLTLKTLRTSRRKAGKLRPNPVQFLQLAIIALGLLAGVGRAMNDEFMEDEDGVITGRIPWKGGIYAGNLEKGPQGHLPHGEGTFKNGDLFYTGEWEAGHYSKGTLTYGDSDSDKKFYEGEFDDKERPHKQGCFTMTGECLEDSGKMVDSVKER